MEQLFGKVPLVGPVAQVPRRQTWNTLLGGQDHLIRLVHEPFPNIALWPQAWKFRALPPAGAFVQP